MDDKKIEEMYQAVMDNNRMLKSARRSAMVGGILKFVFWIFILIILPYFTWLYLQPYLDTIMQQYQTIQGQGAAYNAQAQELQGMFDTAQFKDLYDKYFGSSAE